MKRIILPALFLATSVMAFGQNTKIYTDPDQKYLQARQDFYEQHYGIAYPMFQEIKKEQTSANINNNYLRTQEVDFYNVACALMLREDGADLRAQAFLSGGEN